MMFCQEAKVIQDEDSIKYESYSKDEICILNFLKQSGY